MIWDTCASRGTYDDVDTNIQLRLKAVRAGRTRTSSHVKPNLTSLSFLPNTISDHTRADMTSKAAGLQRAPINEDMLRGIYASDQNMYPAPFAFERLHSWVTACPELSICFTTTAKDNGEGDDAAPVPVGVVVVLPLQKKYWDALIVGKVKEFDIAAAMFASEESGDEDVGLHVFHIERFDSGRPLGSRLPGFAPTALEEVRELAMGKRWNVLGYSGIGHLIFPCRTVLCSKTNR